MSEATGNATLAGGGNAAVQVQTSAAVSNDDGFAALGAALDDAKGIGQTLNIDSAQTASGIPANAKDQVSAWVEQNRANMLKAHESGDHKFVKGFREALDYVHREGAPFPSFITKSMEAQKGYDTRPVVEGEIQVDAYQPMDAEQSRHFANRVAVQNGMTPDDGAAMAEVANAWQLQQDVAYGLGKELANHLHLAAQAGREGDMSIHPDDLRSFADEASRLYGGQDKFITATNQARDVLSKMPCPQGKHGNALKWADARGLTSGTIAFSPRVLNMIVGHGRAKGWIA